MKVITVNDVKVQSEKVLYALKQYCDKVAQYPNFDGQQLLKVYCNADMDFCCFDSVTYRIGFKSTEHRIAEVIYSPYDVQKCTFTEFKEHISVM